MPVAVERRCSFQSSGVEVEHGNEFVRCDRRGLRDERRLGRQGTHGKRPEDAGARARPHGPASGLSHRHQGSLGSALRQPHHAGNAPAQTRADAHRLSRRPPTSTGSSTTSTIPTSKTSPFDWLRGYHVGGRSLMWARQSYRFSPHGFRGERARKASAFRGPSATTKSRRGTTRRKSLPASAAASKACRSCPTANSCRRSISTASKSISRSASTRSSAASSSSAAAPISPRRSRTTRARSAAPASRATCASAAVRSAATSAASRPRCRRPSAPAT